MRLMLLALLILPALAYALPHPILPVSLKPDQVAGLRRAVAPLLEMSEADMLKLVPEQSGLFFVSCANCTAGQQEGQLTIWDVKNPDVVKCAYCGQQYPSDKYPMDQVQEVKTPSGSAARYPYCSGKPVWWKGKDPYRYYFQARIDYHKMRYMEDAAANLARLYWLTKEPAVGRRAALVLDRFAQVYPSYCYHYDYPFQQKIIKDGDVAPQDFNPVFRVARWTWWAYLDISRKLLEAYDLLAGSEEPAKLSAELGHDVPAGMRQMLTMMTQQVLGNRDDLTNMSPGMWADIITSGRVLERPEWVHEPIARVRKMVRSQFFYDGFWMEGTPSYGSQVVGALSNVSAAARGYSDPPDYKDPQTGEHFGSLDLERDLPEMKRAREALQRLRLPSGRYVPVHDTWWSNGGSPLEASRPDLLPGLGHAILGAGEKEYQFQADLTWSPGYGHIHYDGLSMLLFAQGKELLSDLGYTHTKWREWTVLTPSHNLVVVDGLNQKADHMTLGNLRYFTAGPDVQAVSVDNPQVYPDLTGMYRRTMVAVNLSPADHYVVDFFEVKGGQQHDYFLHGSADEAQTLTVVPQLPLAPLPTLLPEGTKFTAGNSENDFDYSPYHAYGYLRDLQSAQPGGGVVTLDYAPVQPGPGLQAFLVTQPGDQLVLGRNPAIRQAQSDDSKLESYWRQFAMLRRMGGASLFAGVLAPYGQAKTVQQVRVVEFPGAKMALEVQSAQRTDLIVLDAQQAQGTWQGKPLMVSGDLAVLGLQDGKPAAASVVAGALQWADLTLKTEPAQTWPLVAVTHGAEPALTVSGPCPATAGAVITLDHGGKYTTAYTVKQAVAEGANTRLLLAEDPGFDWNSTTNTSQFVTVPLSSFSGAHTVSLRPAAHLQRQ